jgi:cytoskeletal protein CcmA (bactofilin family)
MDGNTDLTQGRPFDSEGAQPKTDTASAHISAASLLSSLPRVVPEPAAEPEQPSETVAAVAAVADSAPAASPDEPTASPVADLNRQPAPDPRTRVTTAAEGGLPEPALTPAVTVAVAAAATAPAATAPVATAPVATAPVAAAPVSGAAILAGEAAGGTATQPTLGFDTTAGFPPVQATPAVARTIPEVAPRQMDISATSAKPAPYAELTAPGFAEQPAVVEPQAASVTEVAADVADATDISDAPKTAYAVAESTPVLTPEAETEPAWAETPETPAEVAAETEPAWASELAPETLLVAETAPVAVPEAAPMATTASLSAVLASDGESPVAEAIERDAAAEAERITREQLAAATSEQFISEDVQMGSFSEEPIEAEEEPVEKGISVITREATVLGDILTDGHIDIVGRVKGNIEAKGDVAIHGVVRGDVGGSKIGLYSCRVKGNLDAGLGVIVDDNSIIGGDVKTKNIIFDGKVKGNIDADNVVVLRSHSYCLGDVSAASLAVEPGAILNGKVRTFVEGDLEAPFDEVM